jgi:hypothetical protein
MKTKVKAFNAISIVDLETAINIWIEEYEEYSYSTEGRNFDVINISHSSFMFNRSSNIVTYTALVLYRI